jgi:hypothetical protein
MTAETAAPTPAPNPAPASHQGRFARALNLVRKLIDFGKELAETVLQRTQKIDFAARACNFGTNDLALIVARITQGLLRARALEERLERIAPRLDAKPKAAPPPPRGRSRLPTPVSPTCPRRSGSPLKHAASRSAPSSPISAAISAFCRVIRCGAKCCGRSWNTAAATSPCLKRSSGGRILRAGTKRLPPGCRRRSDPRHQTAPARRNLGWPTAFGYT